MGVTAGKVYVGTLSWSHEAHCPGYSDDNVHRQESEEKAHRVLYVEWPGKSSGRGTTSAAS